MLTRAEQEVFLSILVYAALLVLGMEIFSGGRVILVHLRRPETIGMVFLMLIVIILMELSVKFLLVV